MLAGLYLNIFKWRIYVGWAGHRRQSEQPPPPRGSRPKGSAPQLAYVQELKQFIRQRNGGGSALGRRRSEPPPPPSSNNFSSGEPARAGGRTSVTAASVPEPESSPCVDDTSSSERPATTSSPSASVSETETGYDTQTEVTQAANASDNDEPSQSRRCSEERDDVAADDTKRVALCELTGWL